VEPRISLVTLGVRDLRRAVRFYEEGLGWPRSSVGGDEVAFFRTGGVVLALFPREALAADANLPAAGSGFGGVALAHNVARRELVDAALTAAVAAGGTVLKPAAPSPRLRRVRRLLRRPRRPSVGGGLEPGVPVRRGRLARPARVGAPTCVPSHGHRDRAVAGSAAALPVPRRTPGRGQPARPSPVACPLCSPKGWVRRRMVVPMNTPTKSPPLPRRRGHRGHARGPLPGTNRGPPVPRPCPRARLPGLVARRRQERGPHPRGAARLPARRPPAESGP
jgi:predicted enzyme related to lactoylglutathione lyase